MKYPIKDWKIKEFRKSKQKGKKYAVIIQNKEGKHRIINFGAIGYEHYKDKTGLNLYKDHNDIERRKKYRLRHSTYYNPKYYSPAFFSWNYLW